ncbi:hypothetical protein KA005_70675, partial [bacterium]|nr:hypothetical protein [bacterium]
VDTAARHQQLEKISNEDIAYKEGKIRAKVALIYLWLRKALPAGCFISLIHVPNVPKKGAEQCQRLISMTLLPFVHSCAPVL